MNQELALEALFQCLDKLWTKTRKKKRSSTELFSEQLLKRRKDIEEVHRTLFKKEKGFKQLLEQVKTIEKQVKASHVVWSHGDFNVDNVVFEEKSLTPYFVDVHRSCFQDMVQDVSVFLVSNFRVPIFSKEVRQRLDHASMAMLQFARGFASKVKDESFEMRLALGLVRSFTTSTRFQMDVQFSELMFTRAVELMKWIVEQGHQPKGAKVPNEVILYGKGP